VNIQSVHNISITGIAAAVPKQVTTNPANRSTKLTGVSERRVVEDGTCTSDLCYTSADTMLTDLNIDRTEIDVLIFVSQTPDYKLPVTSALLQDRLGLSQSCICFDIPLGCSGYVYGLYILSTLISNGTLKRGLLLAGDTISREVNPKDSSTCSLFGDAGTATLLSYDASAKPIHFNLGTDGSGYKSIIQTDGGSRNKTTTDSFIEQEDVNGNITTPLDIKLNGAEVYSFGTNKVSEVLLEFCEQLHIQPSQVDYVVLHQANKFMNDRIVSRLGFTNEQAISSIKSFGNTSSATIPLTIITNLEQTQQEQSILMCGFGVGLSWASAYVQQSNIHYNNLIQI
jgi:3-oxoacyl-[acyl-carrier-protein] synthase-3